MSKKNSNKVATFGQAFADAFGGETTAPQTASVKQKYVCPISREDFASNAKALYLHVGGEMVCLPVNPVVEEKALGWKFEQHVVALGAGIEAYVSPYGVWIKNSKVLSQDAKFIEGWDKMPKALPFAITTDTEGKKTVVSGEMKKCRSESGACGYTITGETSQSYPVEVAFSKDLTAKATINRFGLYLTASKS